ncbi:hypothetical protein PGQ11_015562 [Apiospora arundinis]|uniref:Uncharacterized protein n=1 Tax=Apiospora arundinis TaxID=335852 RepID=A0ABR2HLR8_9PEZI
MGSDEDNPRSRYGLSCPVGGQFYICKDSPTRFMGCCDIDPCKNGGICTTSALRSSSFSRGNYGDIPGQDCLVGGAKNWYTCSYNNPPFLGCCLENPCVSGQCHPGNVTAAKLASDEASAAPFLTGGSSSSSSASSSSDESKKGGLPTGAIVGIVIGVVVVLAVIGFLVWRLKQQKKVFYHPPAAQAPPSPPHDVQMGVVSSPHSQHSAIRHLPPKRPQHPVHPSQQLGAHDAAPSGLVLRRQLDAGVLGGAAAVARAA